MTKISKKSAYPKKTPIANDYFVGTDSENLDKTVHFKFDEVASLVKELNDNNTGTTLTERAYAVWTGVGFVYDVIYPDYYIEGVLYTGSTEQITLDASDATNPRQDVIAVDATGAIKVTGTAEANPLVPTVDTVTQIFITSVLVNANATTPIITEENIYKENTEWTTVSNNGTVDFNATTTPFQGTKHIDCGAFINGQYLRFTDTVLNQITDYDNLKFYLNLKAVFVSTTKLSVKFYNGATLVSSTLVINTGTYNFVRTIINSYQTINIPLTAFTFSSSSFDRIEIVTVGSNGTGFRLDNIVLFKGNIGATPLQKSITTIVTDSGVVNATVNDDTILIVGANGCVTSAVGKVITVTPLNQVVNSITNGDTTYSPSGDVIFDALALKVDKVAGKGLSTEDYTTSEKNKLASIDATHYLAPLQTTVQLSALPQAIISDKARVYVENELSDYFYDVTATSGDIAPNDQVGGVGFWRKVAIGGETAASIKVKYESNADTNAFTNALKTKLDSITEIFTTALKGFYDIAYTHSQSAHAPSDAQKNSNITKAEIEAKLTGEISTHTHAGVVSSSINFVVKHFKSYFTAITGYTATGFTPTYSDGRMIFTGGTNDFTKYITIDGLKNTDENIEIEVIYKVTTIGATGYGLGIGKKSFNGWYASSICCQFSPILSTMNIWDGVAMVVPTNLIGTKKFPQVTVNDIIKQKYTQIGNAIIYSVENLTTKIYSEIVVTANLGTTNNFALPNSANICLWNMGSTNEIMSIKTTSLSAFQPDILCIGDSKTMGNAATDINLRWANNIDSLGTVIVNAASADRTVETTQTIDYAKAIKAKYAIVAIGRNDLGSGVASGTWQTNYANIVTQLQSVGTTVIHLLPIPETTITDQSALNTWIIATYGSGNCIDPSVGWNNATMLSSDTVHPNATGYLFIAKKIIDSGLITPSSPIKKLAPIPRPLVPYINDLSIPTQSIGGTIIFFNQPMVYGTSVTAETANITNDLTDAKVGIIQKIYHTSGTAPTYPAGWVLIGSGVYSTTVQNKIFAEFVGGTRVEYWITQ